MKTNRRIALITGASGRGIGNASAHALRSAGFEVWATARRPAAVEALRAEGFCSLELDVTDQSSIQAAAEEILSRRGTVDVLVNNAAFGLLGPVEELDLEMFRQQMETNLVGVLALTQRVLPAMRQQRSGRIINISSMGGEMTFPLAGAYHASKYALEALSDALRLEVSDFGVKVVLIQPSAVKTNFADTSAATLVAKPNSPYEGLLNGMGRAMRESYEKGQGVIPVESVAKVVLQAATEPSPRTRYKVGTTAKMLVRLRHILSDHAWDRLVCRMTGGN